ncbi:MULTISPECIES: hypothetical protein [Bradyrhizobium]|uniref:hypothetical protein n=1 Tax=Bradyrhizobium TaxID=374 RepID=UPI00040EC7EC|nr:MULTISPECIES: hypothetical protein [Bradyrhizobium]
MKRSRGLTGRHPATFSDRVATMRDPHRGDRTGPKQNHDAGDIERPSAFTAAFQLVLIVVIFDISF